MKSLMQFSLPVWAKSVFCGLTASALLFGCSSGPKWLSRNDDADKAGSTKPAATRVDETIDNERFAVASRTKDKTEEKRGFFSKLWRRDSDDAKKPETKTAQKREYQPFESTSLANRYKRDEHPATRDPFLEAEQKRVASAPAGRVHLKGDSEDFADNRSATRTVSRTVIKDTGTASSTNDNPFALLEHKPTRTRTTTGSQQSKTADRLRNQFVPGFDSRLDKLSQTVPQRPIATNDNTKKTEPENPFDIVNRNRSTDTTAKSAVVTPAPKTELAANTERRIEAAPFPTLGQPAEKPVKTETPKPAEDPFQTLAKQQPEATQPKPAATVSGTNLEAILKDTRTRVDEHGRMTDETKSVADKQPVLSPPTVAKAETIPVIAPPKPDPAASPSKLSTGDRSMIVDSENLTERIPIVKEPTLSTKKADAETTQPKLEFQPVQKPIEIQIIPRRRTTPSVQRRDIQLHDITKNEKAEPKSPIMQVTASRVLDTPSGTTGNLLQWRTHPDAKPQAKETEIVDGFVPVGSSRKAAAPGPFPAGDTVASADEPPVAAENIFTPAESGAEDSADGKTRSRTPLWILLGLLAIVATAIAIRRRRLLQG